MAGTKEYVEAIGGFVAQTVLTASSDAKNSLEGIDVSGLQDRATCYVREFLATYRYFDDSVVAPAFPFVVAPADGPGRWLLITVDGASGLPSFGEAAFEEGGTAQLLGATGVWTNVNSPTWGLLFSSADVTQPSNNSFVYSGIARLMHLSGRLSLSSPAPLSVSIGLAVFGGADIAPQTVTLPADEIVQVEVERLVVLDGTLPVSVQLRSNGAGGETVAMYTGELVIVPV